MSIGIIIVTHANIGRSLLHQAELMVGPFPAPVEVMGVLPGDDPAGVEDALTEALARLGDTSGILIFTDVFGATPSNVAHRLADGPECAIVHGLNLAMLLRAHNYGTLPLPELVDKVLEGGRAAIFAGEPT